MDLIDFEELIDLGANISLINSEKQNEDGSQNSAQEPLADVLDKMCAAMVDNDLVKTDPLEGVIHEAKVDTESEEKMCEATVESTDEAARDTAVNLNEFEHILAATYIDNNCTNIDETDNIVDNRIANTALEEIIEPVVLRHNKFWLPNIPIDSEEIAETFTECASLDKDKKLTCSLNCAIDVDTLGAVNVADNEIDNEYSLEIGKLKDIDISFNEDIINIDEFFNDSYEAEENVSIIGNTTNGKRINTSMDSENDIITINSDSDDSYNSSDFEFISEDEANKQGIVYNTKITLKKSMEDNIARAHAAPRDATSKPSTSNPHRNEASPSEYIKYSKHRYQRCCAELSSEHHVIPEGEQFLDMFRGQFAPAIVNDLQMMTNKSVLFPTPMGALFDDLGFGFEGQDLGEEHGQNKEEAEECANKIRAAYPNQNRKRRRRM